MEQDIKDKIRSGRMMSEDITKKVDQEIKDKKEEKLRSDLARRLIKSEQDEGTRLLDLRKNRDMDTPKKAALQETNSAVEKLRAGKITPEEYDAEIRKINENLNKEISKIEDEYETLSRQLYSQTQEALRGW